MSAVSERHTFVGWFRDTGVQIMLEEFVRADSTRSLSVAFRNGPHDVWGPPSPLEQTS